MSKRTIGFMGLGIMGRAMAANVMAAGFSVMVYNRTRERMVPLEEKGAATAETPARLADACDVLVVMVTGDEAVEELFFGDYGAADGLGETKTVINMSTVSPAYTRELAERIQATGASFMDCPVSGSKKPAEDGTLVILAGGDDALVDAHEDLLLAMGKKVVRCGPTGSGALMKMTINLLLGVTLEGLAEATNFAAKAGLDKERFLDVLMSGPLSCLLYELKVPMVKDEHYPVQFPLKHMAKDLGYVTRTALDNGAHIPSALAALSMYALGETRGLGDLDFAAVDKVLRDIVS